MAVSRDGDRFPGDPSRYDWMDPVTLSVADFMAKSQRQALGGYGITAMIAAHALEGLVARDAPVRWERPPAARLRGVLNRLVQADMKLLAARGLAAQYDESVRSTEYSKLAEMAVGDGGFFWELVQGHGREYRSEVAAMISGVMGVHGATCCNTPDIAFSLPYVGNYVHSLQECREEVLVPLLAPPISTTDLETWFLQEG